MVLHVIGDPGNRESALVMRKGILPGSYFKVQAHILNKRTQLLRQRFKEKAKVSQCPLLVFCLEPLLWQSCAVTGGKGTCRWGPAQGSAFGRGSQDGRTWVELGGDPARPSEGRNLRPEAQAVQWLRVSPVFPHQTRTLLLL